MKWRILGGILVVGILAFAVINLRSGAQSDPLPTVEPYRAAGPPATPEEGRGKESPAALPGEVPGLARTEPLTDDEIASLHEEINIKSGDYRARIESRRQLIAQLLKRGPMVGILPELQAMLADVEQTEGEVMTRRVAFGEANTWQANKKYQAAIQAYQVVLDRWPDSNFAAEALMHQGECQLELTNYSEAETIFQRFVERHDASPMAGWGWRKLALAQLLQSRFDESLATLDVMATKFDGTEFADYAKARKGYVLMTAGKTEQARKSYKEFLSGCPQSKYCRLVKRQLNELSKNESDRMSSAVSQR